MALEQVRLGTPPSGSDGDDPRTAFTRINNNAKLLDDSGVSGPVSTAREVTSYNDATQQGRWIGIATASNQPPGFGRAIVNVAVGHDGSITQEAIDISTGRFASRGFNPETMVWSAWTDFEANVRATTLLGLSVTSSAPLSESDSMIVALGKLQAQVNNSGNSNLLLNSNFAVNQRAFAGGSLAAGVYGHDRWGAYIGGANYSVVAATGVVTIASGTICQPIEVAYFNGKTVTISVEAPSAALTVTIGDGSGSSSASGSITAGAGRRSVTLTVPATVTGALQLRLGGTNVSFSKPKLEVGSRATPWQEPMPGQSLQECMRYYYRYFNGAPELRTFGSGTTNVNGLLAARAQRLWPVVMRAAPAVTMGSASAYDGSTVIPISGIQNAYHTRWGFEADLLLASASGQYRPLTLLMASGAAVTADAELPCNV